MAGDMKLLIHNKNPVIHFATLDFRIPFNDSLDSKIKHLQRMMKTRKFVYKEQTDSPLQSLSIQQLWFK